MIGFERIDMLHSVITDLVLSISTETEQWHKSNATLTKDNGKLKLEIKPGAIIYTTEDGAVFRLSNNNQGVQVLYEKDNEHLYGVQTNHYRVGRMVVTRRSGSSISWHVPEYFGYTDTDDDELVAKLKGLKIVNPHISKCALSIYSAYYEIRSIYKVEYRNRANVV